MKIYKDKELKEELSSTIDLGLLEAGKKEIYTFYLYNESKGLVDNININLSYNKEINIIDFPKKLNSEESGKLNIEWSPSITLKQGLKTSLKINYIEIYGD